jgi:hypothetical protein
VRTANIRRYREMVTADAGQGLVHRWGRGCSRPSVRAVQVSYKYSNGCVVVMAGVVVCCCTTKMRFHGVVYVCMCVYVVRLRLRRLPRPQMSPLHAFPGTAFESTPNRSAVPTVFLSDRLMISLALFALLTGCRTLPSIPHSTSTRARSHWKTDNIKCTYCTKNTATGLSGYFCCCLILRLAYTPALLLRFA